MRGKMVRSEKKNDVVYAEKMVKSAKKNDVESAVKDMGEDSKRAGNFGDTQASDP